MLNTLIVAKTISFKVNENRVLKKYTKISEKVSILMNIEFDSELVYGDKDKYIKEKIKSYGNIVNKKFQGKKIPNENASCNCLPLKMLDSVIRVSEKYYPQTYLEGCKYEIKKTKMENLINDNLDLSLSDDETDNEADNESVNESDNE